MDIGKSFGFVFEDDQWVTKLLIAAGITLLGTILFFLVIPPILAAIVLNGYGLWIVRRVIRGESPVLPDWDDWGQLFVDGLMVAIIELVYALPIIAASVCLGTPLGILSENSDAAASVLGSALGCFNLLWAIVMSFLLPAAIAFYAKAGDLGAAFRFGEILSWVRDNFATYLVTAVMAWVASLIGGLGFLVCGVGWLLTIPYAEFVTSHLYGQAFLEASGTPPQAVVEGDVA
jgi:hypothetical protein